MLLCIYTRVSVNEEFFENGDGEMSVYENSRQRVNGLSQSQQIPAAPSRTPVQAEVARLFAPYNVNGGARRNMTRRPAQVQVSRRSYTHTVCCLADHKADKVPSILLKADLLTSGLGEQKVTFSGNDNDPMVITNKLMEVFPKLQEGGGFEFLKIVGSTRSRNLALLQCPSTGYTLAYLKDPSTMIGQATIYIRPLQQDLPLDCVIGRTMRQIKQLRKGLKDVMVWPLLTSRPDVVPLLFPKMAEMQFTPQMLLEKITWPCEDSDDEDFDIESTCLITSFLRMFIETASSGTLAQLLTFWVGWEMLPPELKVEISGGTLPTSSTCFETLKLPAHFKTYMDFEKALVSAINSAQTGFGLV